MTNPPWATAVRLLLGIACVAVALWAAFTRFDALRAGHPAYPVLLTVVAVIGLLVIVRSRRARRTGGLRVTARVAGALALVVIVAAAAWLRPYAATPVAEAATVSSSTVEVVDGVDTWEFRPRGGPAGAGVVFYPGALVDPRAYLALLRPLAEQGHLVVVVKAPLDVALLAPGAATAAFDAHPEVRSWAVGGHSLGGVSAAAVLDPRMRGLFFWASYPARDLSGGDVAVASISGDRDGLSTPADIAASRAQLPAATTFTVVAGGVHAYFGDYGPQAGDGDAGVPRADAQRQIVAATAGFVASLG